MKKWAKFLCCFALLGAFLVGGLAGCGTVSDIKNKNAELIYNGNAATLVETDGGKFLYFSNAFATAPTSEKEYSSAKKYSYLARVNGSKLDAKNAYFSPKNVENVSEEVAGYADSFMFVLGQNIYYATPNRQMVTIEKDGKKETAYHFEFTCFYKSSLNGDHKQKLYTSSGDISKLEVLKFENTYYIVMLAGENLVTINLSNGKAQTLATGVTSVALPKTFRKDVVGSTLDWNGQIYFTTAREDEGNSGASTNVVKKISVSSTKTEDAEVVYEQGTVTFVARERDVVFFTDKVENKQAAVYMVDLTGAVEATAFLPTSQFRKTIFEGESISETSISDLNLVTMTTNSQNNVMGYVFKAGSTWKYLTKNGTIGTIDFSTDVSSAKNVFVSGRRIYFSTTSDLMRADLTKIFLGSSTTAEVETFATLTDISDSASVSFDGDYLYFYAKLQEIPEDLKDEDEKEDEKEETDDNYYLYRARVDGKDEFELLGKATIESRRTK